MGSQGSKGDGGERGPDPEAMGDRKQEQQHGHDGPDLFSTLFACKCLERAMGRRGVMAQAELLHSSALQMPGAHGHIPASSHDVALGKGCSYGSVVGSRPESEELGRSLHLSGTSRKILL